MFVPIRRGEDHPRAKLTNAQRNDCRERWRDGASSIGQLSREFGLSKSNIHRIVHQPIAREKKLPRSD